MENQQLEVIAKLVHSTQKYHQEVQEYHKAVHRYHEEVRQYHKSGRTNGQILVSLCLITLAIVAYNTFSDNPLLNSIIAPYISTNPQPKEVQPETLKPPVQEHWKEVSPPKPRVLPTKFIAFKDLAGKGEKEWLIEKLRVEYNIQIRGESELDSSSYYIVIDRKVGKGRMEDTFKEDIVSISKVVKHVIYLRVEATDFPDDKKTNNSFESNNISSFKLQIPVPDGIVHKNNLEEENKEYSHKKLNLVVVEQIKQLLL